MRIALYIFAGWCAGTLLLTAIAAWLLTRPRRP